MYGLIREPPKERQPPICCDCRFFRDGEISECVNIRTSVWEPVRGRTPIKARTARHGSECGLDGKLFEPRPMPTWFEDNYAKLFVGTFGTILLLWAYWPALVELRRLIHGGD